MENLEDIAATPDPRLENGTKHIPYNAHEQDSDYESEQGDEGDMALLGSPRRTRGRERIQGRSLQGWQQVKGIVLEVSLHAIPCSAMLSMSSRVRRPFCSQQLVFYLLASFWTMLRCAASHSSKYLLLTIFILQRWKAMRTIDELIMIIPVILNLKGNLEMNLSARLGTAANVGELDDPETRGGIIFGNLSLLQVQATVVSFVAACVSLILGLFVPKLPLQSGSPSAPNTFSLVPSTNATLYHHSRRPRPPLPINNGRPKSGFAEYALFIYLTQH